MVPNFSQTIATPSQARPVCGARRLWSRAIVCGYGALVAVLLAYYVFVFTDTVGAGVDFACFRAAALVIAHGGNPYDFAQLWHAENALYNLPYHLHPGAPTYYYLDRYYNPPLFASALIPLSGLSFALGYAVYTAAVIGFAVAGTWLLLTALGWTRHRLIASALVLASPCVFLAVRNGQQSTLVLFALGAALYAARRERYGLSGALLVLSLAKPHLLVPFALAAPLLLPSRRATLRWYAGFGAALVGGIALTVLTSGVPSLLAWLHTFVGYTGYADTIQSYMPSLSGMSLIVLAHPWNRVIAAALIAAGLGVMGWTITHVRAGLVSREIGLALLLASWLLFTPFAHTNDDVLLLLPLAVAVGPNAVEAARPWAVAVIWSCLALPLAFLLALPTSLLGLVPVALIFAAAMQRAWR